MAATETPPSPPENSPQNVPGDLPGNGLEPQLDRLPSRYDSRSPNELLEIIDEMEGSRLSARVREAIWVSLILHLLVFWWVIYGPRPKFLRSAQVVNPAAVNPEKQQQVYLEMPPDALKQKPKQPTNVISDQSHVAQTKHPTQEQKTIDQLQAMRRAGRPTPPPQPRQQARPQQSPPQPQQQARAAQPAPPTHAQPEPSLPSAPSAIQSPPQHSQSRARAREQQQAQSTQQPNMSVGDMIRQAERNALRSNGEGGDNGEGAPVAHPGLQSGVEVLSDTMGVDFGPYLRQVVQATQSSWDLLIPEAARPPLLKKGKVAIQFIIAPDGSVKQMQLALPSGDVSLDRAAWGGITGASPYPPLPKQFHGPYLALRFYFLYNEQTGEFTPQ